jgi:hypothetical protein
MVHRSCMQPPRVCMCLVWSGLASEPNARKPTLVNGHASSTIVRYSSATRGWDVAAGPRPMTGGGPIRGCCPGAIPPTREPSSGCAEVGADWGAPQPPDGPVPPPLKHVHEVDRRVNFGMVVIKINIGEKNQETKALRRGCSQAASFFFETG